MRRGLAVLAVFALLLTACRSSGDDDESPTATAPSGGPSPAATAPASPTRPASPTATPSASPTADASAERQAVIDAATSFLDALYVSPLTRDACVADNPDNKICIELTSGEESVAAGLAMFAAGDPEGGPFDFWMGRVDDGSWAYWFGTQQDSYVPGSLPTELLICSDAESVEIHEGPSDDSPVLQALDELTSVQASEFLLTSAGERGAGERGTGWYRLSAPIEGWVEGSNASRADLGDCTLHDSIERSGGHG
ncbi:MAG: hypothetical protein ACM3S1_07790 [Hyphomicrobiales bacterium]